MSGPDDDAAAQRPDQGDGAPPRPPAGESVRAGAILRLPGIWIGPLVITAVLIALIALIYIGSVVNPAGHLHGLPVMVVNQDAGATVHGRRVDLGDQIVEALQQSPAASKLALTTTSLGAAKAKMDAAKAYGTLVIPPTLTKTTVQAAGLEAPSGQGPPRPALMLLENGRLGSLGVGLASGVLTPATAQISTTVAKKLTRMRALT